MECDNIMVLQRENSDELQKYLLDLDCWEKEMKKKEEEFKLSPHAEEEIPPVRNLLYRSKRKNRHKKQKDKNVANKDQISDNGDQTSENGDQASESGDAENEMREESIDVEQTEECAENSSDHEEEIEVLRKKQLAYLHKEKGNEFFKQGNYDSAINSYTTGMQLDPENPLLPANRAMAFLKKEQFQAAENDCTLTISLDPTYVKAYLRRGSARKKLNKFLLSKEDFSKVLELEPENKQAKIELMQIAQKYSKEDMDNIPEGEVVKTQKLWSQFLGRETVTHSEEKMEIDHSSDLSNIENECIFPNSSPIMPSKRPTTGIDLNPKFEIAVKKMEEEKFVKLVEEKIKSLKEFPSKESAETLIVEKEIKPNLPPVPSTSFQFLADWNGIVHYPDLRHKYLKQFPPEKLPVVFKHHMEPEIFSSILETLCTSFLEHGDNVFDYVKYLPDVGRFDTMIMFLSDKEEKDLNRLLGGIKTSERPESEISDVLQKYRA